MTAKYTTNASPEHVKFNQILNFAQTYVSESYPWLVLIKNETIQIGPFSIKKQADYWVLENNQNINHKFQTRSAALAYCAFYKRKQYYQAERTAELDKKLELLELEISQRKTLIQQARKKSNHWQADVQTARYLENLSEYKKIKTELVKNVQQAKYMKI